jgi:uncharacterized repeat protein (TIGR03803 family)
VVMDATGNLYGATPGGGASQAGVVYKRDPHGHAQDLYAFTGRGDGKYPEGVVLDAAGNLYGTTLEGGRGGAGTVFRLDPAGHLKVLYSFTGGVDGGGPNAGLVLDPAGNLYGTTQYGQASTCVGCGVVYKLDPAGNQSVLHTFGNIDDGIFPNSGLIMDAAGNLYGTTATEGAGGAGTVYKVNTAGGFTVLYSFNGPEGAYPEGGLALDAAGNLYGVTNQGGPGNAGVVYQLSPAGQETVLYGFSFTSTGGGIYPTAGVVLDQAGNIYGSTTGGGSQGGGIVFKLEGAVQARIGSLVRR